MATLLDYVLLASHAYRPSSETLSIPGGWGVPQSLSIDDGPWFAGHSRVSSGLQCRAYVNTKQSEAVVAYMGTKPTMVSGLLADAALSLWDIPTQMREALLRTENWASKLKQAGVHRVTLTGHSLGGAIAQYVGAKSKPKSLGFVTFNAPGMLANTSGISANPWSPQNLKLGVNYIMWGDVIGNFGRHIGSTVRLSPKSLGTPIAAGAAAAALGVAAPVAAAIASVAANHGIAVFMQQLHGGDPRFDPMMNPL